MLLDKEWTLEELGEVSSKYNQLYAFAYSLLPNLSASHRLHVITAYANLPWQGGYSTVNFFHHVFRLIPSGDQPQVTQITYASPGFIELAALIPACWAVSRIVTALANAIGQQTIPTITSVKACENANSVNCELTLRR
ncbi:hypothetical protein NWF32_00050 [Pseudomonas qingdaonensis]|nr:hypothetical protein [Pseudomonas qingdaonensis]